MGFFIDAYRFATAGIAYLLKTDFSAVTGQPVTLTNGQVLDTVGEGMVTGSLTVTDTSAVNLVIASNLLSTSGSNNNNYTNLGMASTTALATANGRILKFVHNVGSSVAAETQEIMVGFKDASGVNYTSALCLFFFRLTGLVQVFNSSLNPITLATIVINTTYSCAIVQGVSSYYMFVKGGVFSTWTLLFIEPTAPSGSDYFVITSAETIAGIGYAAVTETLYPNLVQTIAEDDFSEADGTAIAGKALDKGGSWTLKLTDNPSGISFINATVQSGAATIQATSGTSQQVSQYFQCGDTGHSDMLVCADIILPAASEVTVAMGARCNNSGDYLTTRTLVQANIRAGASQTINLYELTNGGVALRGSTNTAINGGTNAAMLRVVGNQALCIVGSASISGTLASPTTHKTAMFAVADTYNVVSGRFDNFKVYPATGYDTILDSI